MQPWSQPLLWKGAAVVHDPYFGNVVLLMPMDGPNTSQGAPGYNDFSPSAHGTASGIGAATTISTNQSKFGGSSLNAGGISTVGGLSFPDSTDWALGSGAFTIECWIYPTGLTTTGYMVGQWGTSPKLGWTLLLTGAGFNQLTFSVSTTGSNNITVAQSTTTVSTNQWYACCVDFDGTKYRLYLNGTMVASSTTLQTIFHPSQLLCVGTIPSGAGGPHAYIDEVRITKGIARYASDAGYIVPTTAFPQS